MRSSVRRSASPALVPRQPFRRLKWRITVLFALGSALTIALVHVLGSALLLYLFLGTRMVLNDVREELRNDRVNVTEIWRNGTPDRLKISNAIHAALLNDEDETGAETGIRIQILTFNSARLMGLVADARTSEILSTSARHLQEYPPGTPLLDKLSPGEKALYERAKNGEYTGEWVNHRMVFTGPVKQNGQVVGIIFARSSITTLQGILGNQLGEQILGSFIWASIIATVVGSVIGFVVSRIVTHRLLAVSVAADRWATGDLSARVPETPSDELGLLGHHLNGMVSDLQSVIELRNTVAVLEERQRITRELHDTVKQEAFATALVTATARQYLERRDWESLRSTLNEAHDLSRRMQTNLSNILSHLREQASPTLSERLREIAQGWSRRSGLRVVAEVGNDIDSNIGLVHSEHVVRVAEEAVANAVKHSRGSEIVLRLQRDSGGWRLTVTDDGIGFQPGARQESGSGMGLQTMRERAALLPDGSLEVSSVSPHGTRVTLQFGGDNGR